MKTLTYTITSAVIIAVITIITSCSRTKIISDNPTPLKDSVYIDPNGDSILVSYFDKNTPKMSFLGVSAVEQNIAHMKNYSSIRNNRNETMAYSWMDSIEHKAKIKLRNGKSFPIYSELGTYVSPDGNTFLQMGTKNCFYDGYPCPNKDFVFYNNSGKKINELSSSYNAHKISISNNGLFSIVSADTNNTQGVVCLYSMQDGLIWERLIGKDNFAYETYISEQGYYNSASYIVNLKTRKKGDYFWYDGFVVFDKNGDLILKRNSNTKIEFKSFYKNYLAYTEGSIYNIFDLSRKELIYSDYYAVSFLSFIVYNNLLITCTTNFNNDKLYLKIIDINTKKIKIETAITYNVILGNYNLKIDSSNILSLYTPTQQYNFSIQ